MMEIPKLKELEEHEYTFFNFIAEDKSIYPKASDKGYKDSDDDFIVGKSGGFLLNIDFIFVSTHVFKEVANYFEKHGYYIDEEKGSIDFKNFYRRETYRRKYGMTSNCKLYFKDIAEYTDKNTTEKRRKELLHPLRITGDHYNFLNYGRIYRSLREDEKATYVGYKGKIPKKKYGFPNFIDGQYWNFKVDEFIYYNGFHLCKSKARRKGFSFMRGSQASNTLNLNKDLTVVLAAYDLKYLTDPGATTDMVKKNLDWYEEHTYWQRGYLSEDYSAIELGYKKQKEGNKKFGFRSKLLSLGCRNNESAVVGKDSFEIDFEEAGKFPNLSNVLDVTTSTAEDGDTKVGTIRIYGTGGTKDANWLAFRKIFFAPEANEMMPFENVWDDDLRNRTCGLFYPQVWGYGTKVDEHGNSKLLESYEHDLQRKEEYKKQNPDHKTIMFIAQRANRPAEAFLNTRDNMFSSVALNQWITRLQYDPDVQFYKDGQIIETSSGPVFKTNQKLRQEGKSIHEFITDVPVTPTTNVTGCVRIIHEPYTINGKVPDNLYFVTSDSVGIDKDKKELTIRHSLNSFSVWMKDTDGITPYAGKRLVASYCGRYDTLKEYDKLLLNICKIYNAKVLAEVNRGETISNFKQWGELNRMLKDPRSLISKGKYTMNAGYGMIIGEQDTKLEGLRMLKELIYTKFNVDSDGNFNYFLHYIYDIAFLLELQSFTLDGNFDRISNAILAAFQFKAFDVKEKKERQQTKKPNSKRIINRLLYHAN